MIRSTVPLMAAIQTAMARPANLGMASTSKNPDEVAREMASSADRVNSGIATTANGMQVGFIQIDPSIGHQKNKWIQWDLTNASGANAYQVRIGSLMGEAGAYARFGLPATGASDTANVSDQVGANVVGLQGFSKITQVRPILVTEIQVTTTDAAQLNKEWTYRELQLDGTSPVDKKINVSATAEKSDNRTDLLVMEGQWILDPMHWLEFQIKITCSVTIKLLVEAWSNIVNFTQYGD